MINEIISAANAGPSVGQNAGNAIQAPPDQPHLLDRESILTLCLLYLVDNNRVPHTRLQKVLRSACVNQTTCDFIVWCLLALLDKASEANTDDEEVIYNFSENSEKIVKFSRNLAKISTKKALKFLRKMAKKYSKISRKWLKIN